MAGQPGRSGGANKKTLAELVLMGSYKPSRHRHLLERAVEPTDWQPSAADLALLGEAGRAFVGQMVAAFEFSLQDGVLLMEAAHAADACAHWRAEPRDARSSRLALAWSKQLAALLHQLKASR
ncbi:MAG TPA: hypothetical protein VNJ04_05420 [Gemmatimonadaceae bacterium]|nr:hypothetical protein [Gemmatimonadaceae bacterium]